LTVHSGTLPQFFTFKRAGWSLYQCCGSGSGSASASGSGSFYHHAKIVRKTLIPTFVTLLNFLSLKKDVNVSSKSNKQKKFLKKFVFCWHLEGL
jgi:hypothetical protein